MAPKRRCIAIIADVLQSRRLEAAEREELQAQLESAVVRVNEAYERVILSRFLVTVGDELQGLLTGAGSLPDIIWDLEAQLADAEIRVGVGCGELHTPLKDEAIAMDGPVWHHARGAVDRARAEALLGGVFSGFGESEDLILNGFARLLRHMRADLTDRQREILGLLRTRPTQVEVAQILQITPQAVSKQVQAAGWTAHSEGERAWRAVLGKFDFYDDWPS